MDNLQAMRVFARVVETGNFTKAAESLRMPLATASKLVQDLEAQLGVKLLQRNTRSLATTSDGADYYERTLPIVLAVDEINSSFGSGKHAVTGKIRVSSGASLATSVIVPAFPEFHARHPDITIDLRIDDRPTDVIKEGVDCAIRGGPMHDPTLVARKLGDIAWMTCASPAYLERFGTPAQPDDLRHHRVVGHISARTGLLVPVVLGTGDTRIEIEPTGPLSVNEGNAHLAAGLAGIGIIQSLSFKTHVHVAKGTLVPLLEAWHPAPYPYHVVYPHNRHLNPRLRFFVEWLAEVFAALE